MSVKAEQLGFYFDTNRCVQCHACELACRSLHHTDSGAGWRSVVSVWQGEYPHVTNRAISLACMHCGQPACQRACPRGAIQKRTTDGIVVVDQEKCIGCHACLWVCPFGVPRFGSNWKMQKCDSCSDLVRKGKEPACVATCPSEALLFGTLSELSNQARKKCAKKLVEG
jgi:anaerobic dimethyl sulfoxide reductase subunit B